MKKQIKEGKKFKRLSEEDEEEFNLPPDILF
jgi:hypothetical protein